MIAIGPYRIEYPENGLSYSGFQSHAQMRNMKSHSWEELLISNANMIIAAAMSIAPTAMSSTPMRFSGVLLQFFIVLFCLGIRKLLPFA